jgi:NhaB family Na+:H+ antiporter
LRPHDRIAIRNAMLQLLARNFLGKTPPWYKYTVLGFLILNPLIFFLVSPFVAGWLVLLEFIFILALALQCYPVPAGGLLAIEAAVIGIAKPESIYNEIVANLPTVLLLIFMVAGIYYLKDVLSLIFTKLFLKFRKKWQVSLVFCVVSACTAAFLDALTLLAVLIAVCFNFFAVYHRAAGAYADDPKNQTNNELDEFRGFLRNLIMHSAVGTALGGTLTLVGEPQNLMIGTKMGWSFVEFFEHCGIIAVPVALGGFILCPLLEIFRVPGFGHQLSVRARQLIVNDYEKKARELAGQGVYKYVLQGVVALLLLLALGFHVAEVGLIGLAVIVILSAFTGMTKEHDFAEAFNNAMPFVTLIVIFFAILAVVHDQHLVTPIIRWVLSFEGQMQLLVLYVVNGVMSMVSDSVFVASVFITEMDKLYKAGVFSLDWYQNLATVVNMGTNIPSLGTPNGTAGFLFLLTSALAPLIKLSYFQMLKIMIPYFIVLSSIGGFMVYFFLR